MLVSKVYELLNRIYRNSNYQFTYMYILLRKFFVIFINLYVKIVYRLTSPKIDNNYRYNGKKVIVSLTTYSTRIKNVWIAIESIMRQTILPTEIILWLDENEYNNDTKYPKSIRKLLNRGLTIKYCENLKSHKKYYYTILENPDDFTILIDDDIIYHEKLIEELLNTYDKNKSNVIVCHRAHKILFDNKKMQPYSKWLKGAAGDKGPSYLLCQTNGGGTLIPPHVLPDITFNKQYIYDLCLFADDIWLKFTSAMNNIPIVKVKDVSLPIIEIIGTRKIKLSSKNIEENKNDEQIENILKKFNIDLLTLQSGLEREKLCLK